MNFYPEYEDKPEWGYVEFKCGYCDKPYERLITKASYDAENFKDACELRGGMCLDCRAPYANEEL